MTEILITMIDPAEGWKYGFPKHYDNPENVSMTDWLIANGYPEMLAKKNWPVRMWKQPAKPG